MSVRLSYADCNNDGVIQPSSEILEENNYYPFGLKHQGYNELANSCRSEQAEKYQYNGKEWNDALGLNIYEMDLRQYDPAIGRWTVQDPVIHHEFSPYSAFDNNPVYWADPSGADAISVSLMDLFNSAGSGITTFSFENGVLTEKSSFATIEAFLQSVYEMADVDDSNDGGSGGLGNCNGGGNGNGTVTSPIVENGVQVLEAKTSFLGKLWATVEPREWTDRETGFVYQVDADGKIMGLRPLGGLGALGYINGSNGVKLLVQFGKTENQIYHTFRHVEKMGLDKTIVQSAIMKHFQTVYKEIKTGESLNKVITVQGQQIQYSAYRLSDGTINIGRIHGIK